MAPKRKVAETPNRFDRHRAQICPNPNTVAYFKGPRTRAHVGMPCRQVPETLYWFLNIHKYVSFHICAHTQVSFHMYSCLSEIPPVHQKKMRINFPVFLSMQLTALLLKGLRIRLHCYTLVTKQ